jgi:hypothetical protein
MLASESNGVAAPKPGVKQHVKPYPLPCPDWPALLVPLVGTASTVQLALRAALLVASATIRPSRLVKAGVSNAAISLPYIQSRSALSWRQFLEKRQHIPALQLTPDHQILILRCRDQWS